MRRLGLALVIGVLAVVSTPVSAADHAVRIVDNAYDPPTVTIGVGDLVQWTNGGSRLHTVTADNGEFGNNGVLAPGATYSHSFASAGTFRYHCEVHGPGMSGTVVVRQAAPTPTAAPAPTTTTTARPAGTTTTARPSSSGTTTTVAPGGSTTTFLESATSSTSSTSSTTSTTEVDELASDDDDDDGGGGGVPAVLIGLAIVAFLAAGGYALWRFRPTPGE